MGMFREGMRYSAAIRPGGERRQRNVKMSSCLANVSNSANGDAHEAARDRPELYWQLKDGQACLPTPSSPESARAAQSWASRRLPEANGSRQRVVPHGSRRNPADAHHRSAKWDNIAFRVSPTSSCRHPAIAELEPAISVGDGDSILMAQKLADELAAWPSASDRVLIHWTLRRSRCRTAWEMKPW